MKNFSKINIPSISFLYNKESSEEFIKKSTQKLITEKTTSGFIYRQTIFNSATDVKITISTRTFDDFPDAVEWITEIENCGYRKTSIIEDIMPLDMMIPAEKDEKILLHHAKGSQCRMDDFLPLTTELFPSSKVILAPEGGRSSNGVLPFMNVQKSGCGIILGVGWSGQWKAEFNRDDSGIHIKAGMEKTHLFLHPGEKIRTPSILIIEWNGDDFEKGNNLLRQLLLKHYIPKIKGKPVNPPAAQCLQSYFYLTGKAGETIEMTALKKAATIGIDTYWIDACWYGGKGDWWQEVGSWVINEEKFPNGLKPIADASHKAGMKFLLWFEPERVRKNSIIHKEHPEFLLINKEDSGNFLLNLGMPEALNYIKNLVSDYISNIGIDIYRQDFNIDPLPYWRAADADDRQGITEIRYIEGLYKLWDELIQQHPNIAIDNCSSGGRRIDLETISRSLPLWPSDFLDICGLNTGHGVYTGSQCIKAGLARWIPLFGGGAWNFTPYGFRSVIIGGFTFGFNIDDKYFPSDDEKKIKTWEYILSHGKTLLDNDFPLDLVKSAINEWKTIKEFFTGNFYLLLPLTISYHDWCAWQFHREDLDSGIAVFFRRHESPFPAIETSLREVKPDQDYDVSISPDFTEKPRKRIKGQKLLNLKITIRQSPGSVLLRYSHVK
ncbi:MAG TPA: alpha-galactosidase [bacterium]|mgnify:CR=1 FL=1|nr:alpha-galactosidase [bacterium]